MSRINGYKCDKCGAFEVTYLFPMGWVRITIKSADTEFDLDFCPRCQKAKTSVAGMIILDDRRTVKSGKPDDDDEDTMLDEPEF